MTTTKKKSYSVPNQRAIHIHRESIGTQFISINSENWMAAARDLGAHAFLLYLYFAKNKDGYTDELSPAAIRELIGMPESTYRDQFKKLLMKGYLVKINERYYDFYEKPAATPTEENTDLSDVPQNLRDGDENTAAVQSTATIGTEINKIDNRYNNKQDTYTDDSGVWVPKVKEIVIKRPKSETPERTRLIKQGEMLNNTKVSREEFIF